MAAIELAPGGTALLFVELGVAVIGLAVLSRFASRFGFSAIPLYLLAGLAFGTGGLAPIRVSQEFVHVGAEVGVVLLLFMLGLEYSGEKLVGTLKTGFFAGALDLVLNFAPGLIAGYILRLTPIGSVLLGGVTYISSSGIISKVLTELRRMSNSETSTIVKILVLEDLAMAIYLPVVAVLLTGQTFASGLIAVSIALVTVIAILFVAVRFGSRLSKFVANQPDEGLLLSTLGLVLLVAGIAESLHVSAAVGAFLVGVAVSGPMVERTHRLIAPLRDLFAATLFLFFGLQIDPGTLPPVLVPAVLLGLVTAGTKVLTGWIAAKNDGEGKAGALRAGCTLIARGEFSIVIAGIGAEVDPKLGPLAAAYVLFLAILGPFLARLSWSPKGRVEVAEGRLA